jgi:hypothetical protein
VLNFGIIDIFFLFCGCTDPVSDTLASISIVIYSVLSWSFSLHFLMHTFFVSLYVI